ncbi:MAG: winged helix DNA-binding domain-containing protein [Marmoricola sp.]
MDLVRTITDEERRARLGRRHGLGEPCRDAVGAARSVVCLHATEPASVHLAAWARSGAVRADVDAALYEHRTLVKQLAMRRTVFAFPEELLPAVWGSAAARVARQQQDRLARDVVQHGLADDGPAWVAQVCAAVLERLRSAGPATTTELRAAVPALEGRVSVSPGKEYGGEFPIASRVLTTLAASGGVVRGTNAGGWKTSRPRWTATEDWLGRPADPATEAAGYARLVRAWLDRFGPGTEADIVWWLGATKAAVRGALTAVGAVEVAVVGGGEPAYVLPEDLDPVEPVAPWAALLPALDPTTMAWKQRNFYLGPHADAVFDRNGNAGPTAWWDGRVVGGWTQDADGVVVVVPAEELPPEAARALAQKAVELTDWLDGDVVRSIYQSPLVRGRG